MTASVEKRSIVCCGCPGKAVSRVFTTLPGETETTAALCEGCTKKRRDAFVEAAEQGSEMRVRSIDE
jgi:hypothetical protein